MRFDGGASDGRTTCSAAQATCTQSTIAARRKAADLITSVRQVSSVTRIRDPTNTWKLPCQCGPVFRINGLTGLGARTQMACHRNHRQQLAATLSKRGKRV